MLKWYVIHIFTFFTLAKSNGPATGIGMRGDLMIALCVLHKSCSVDTKQLYQHDFIATSSVYLTAYVSLLLI